MTHSLRYFFYLWLSVLLTQARSHGVAWRADLARASAGRGRANISYLLVREADFQSTLRRYSAISA